MNVSIAVFIPLDFSGFYVCCLFNIFSLVWGLGTGRFKFLIFPPSSFELVAFFIVNIA